MKKNSISFLAALFLLGSLQGCARVDAVRAVHDEVLVYRLPYDLAFLRTLEAVDEHPDWELGWTDKEKGIIFIRNLRYSSFSSADQRKATVILKRIHEDETSVELAPDSQSLIGIEEVLALIKESLSRELQLRSG